MKYVIYASKRSDEATEEQIDKIILSAERNNGISDISGVLLIKRDYFLQYYEGEDFDVEALYQRLELDTRHYDIKLLDSGNIDDRIFPDWKMFPIKNSIEHKDYIKRIESCPIPHLRHLITKFFIKESPVSIAYNKLPF